MTLLMAAALPLIWWTGPAATAEQARDLGAALICVDAESLELWRKVYQQVQLCSMQGRQRAVTPGIDPQVNVASATRSPWINANGWRFRRSPTAEYVYEGTGRMAPLAIAEAFVFGVTAAVRTTSDDVRRAAAMSHFVASIPGTATKPMADLFFVDDGTAQAGEAMNLLSRRNILFQRISPSDQPSGKIVRIGSPEFPKSLVANPSEFAQKVRQWIGDDRRTVRIYGTENVLVQVADAGSSVRVHLLNYTANPVEGIRVRLQGKFSSLQIRAFDVEDAKPEDVSLADGEVEFTIAVMKEYAFVELKR